VVQKGYSELAPVACNDLLEGRNLNRRVEVWVRE
jgi:outer membrane protein OmpA-like peptidoglycan-associated protein